VRETPVRIGFSGLDENDAWQPVTWFLYAERVARIAAALRAAGLGRGHRAAILAPTSMDWQYTQMACLVRGIAVVGIDPNYARDQRDDALRSVAIDALFVQDERVVASIPADIKAGLKRFVTFRSGSGSPPFPATTLDALMQPVVERYSMDEVAADVEPDDEALVVFSSGTTGRPKAIAYTHRQVLLAIQSILDAYSDIEEGSHLLCWLPLANLFQRVVDFCGIERGATSYVIEDPKAVMQYVRRVNPHLLIGVPRFYEKLYAGVRDKIAESSRPVSAAANWALEAGVRRARAARGAGPSFAVARLSGRVADRLVLRRLRSMFGSNMRYLVSGSAPMPLWLLDWFEGIGFPVFEAYGVSEDIVPIAMNRPGARRPGTVGKPLAGQEVLLADDNEILVRGPGVFSGYAGKTPGDLPAPDDHGFWATGDYGEFDADGFLRVRGRKSDAFKLSTGRWVAPATIEDPFRRLPYVEHAMVLGAGQRHIVALVSLDPARIPGSAKGPAATEGAAAPPGLDEDDAIRRDVLEATALLPPFQRPRGLLLTTRVFTIAGGELTSNLKLRRNVVEKEFASQIQRLFAALNNLPDGQDGPERGQETPLLVLRA